MTITTFLNTIEIIAILTALTAILAIIGILYTEHKTAPTPPRYFDVPRDYRETENIIRLRSGGYRH